MDTPLKLKFQAGSMESTLEGFLKLQNSPELPFTGTKE